GVSPGQKAVPAPIELGPTKRERYPESRFMNNDDTTDKKADSRAPRPFPECASNTHPLGMGRCLAWVGSFLLLFLSLTAFAANEETFAVLRVGDHVYQNVKVTTKRKNFIIIVHSGGITSIKVSELPAEVLVELGYAPPPAPKKHIKTPALLASMGVPNPDMGFMKPIQAKLS